MKTKSIGGDRYCAMKSGSALAPRSVEILHSLVREYLATGQPVGSRTIARKRGDVLSAATIRNVMADLADAGYLSQPHTSAGRVPTEKALRHYVDTLHATRLPPADMERVRTELSEVVTLEERVERSSVVLMDLTHNLGVAAAIADSSQKLDQVELIQLSQRQVLMVVITQDRIVHNRVVALETDLSQDELNSIRNYINYNFHGWSLNAARNELRRRLEQESTAYEEILRRLIVLYSKGFLDVEPVAEIHSEGVSNLVGLEFNLNRERLRELFRALEEKKKLLDLLDRFLGEQSDKVGVHVGLGEVHPAMKELSLIGASFPLPSGVVAKIAVIGPTRMNYERVMSAVWNVALVFRLLPSGYPPRAGG